MKKVIQRCGVDTVADLQRLFADFADYAAPETIYLESVGELSLVFLEETLSDGSLAYSIKFVERYNKG